MEKADSSQANHEHQHSESDSFSTSDVNFALPSMAPPAFQLSTAETEESEGLETVDLMNKGGDGFTSPPPPQDNVGTHSNTSVSQAENSVMQRILDESKQTEILNALEAFNIKRTYEVNELLSEFFAARDTFTASISFISGLHRVVGNENSGRPTPYGQQSYVWQVAKFSKEVSRIIDGIDGDLVNEVIMEDAEGLDVVEDIGDREPLINEHNDLMDTGEDESEDEDLVQEDGTYEGIVTSIDLRKTTICLNDSDVRIPLYNHYGIELLKLGDEVRVEIKDGTDDDFDLLTSETTSLGGTVGTGSKELNIGISKQSMPLSCWAAVSAGIANFAQSTTEHTEDSVAKAVGKPLENGYLVAETLGALGIGTRRIPDTLEMSELKQELDANKPVIAAVSGKIGHAVVICGYREEGTSEIDTKLKIMDPTFGNFYWLTYRHFVMGSSKIRVGLTIPQQISEGWCESVVLT